jgi:hypothetical protein
MGLLGFQQLPSPWDAFTYSCPAVYLCKRARVAPSDLGVGC